MSPGKNPVGQVATQVFVVDTPTSPAGHLSRQVLLIGSANDKSGQVAVQVAPVVKKKPELQRLQAVGLGHLRQFAAQAVHSNG